MIIFPNAKINLGLFVTQKRPDGFHDIETLFLPVQWHDVIEFYESKIFSLKTFGRIVPTATEDNLIFKAWDKLHTLYKIPPVEVFLYKNIPMGAGLGGGSADAAYMLKALTQKFKLPISETQLEQEAAQLGSDCPFFIKNKPALGRGRGNELTNKEITFPEGYEILIVWSEIHSDTAAAYRGIQPKAAPETWLDIFSRDIESWKEVIKNDFEETIFQNYPSITLLKQQLYDAGASYASMSGSGSAVFGIFKKGLINKVLIEQLKVKPENFCITAFNHG